MVKKKKELQYTLWNARLELEQHGDFTGKTGENQDKVGSLVNSNGPMLGFLILTTVLLGEAG